MFEPLGAAVLVFVAVVEEGEEGEGLGELMVGLRGGHVGLGIGFRMWDVVWGR